jgi:transcriptional regulator with XRE-family HTH domain
MERTPSQRVISYLKSKQITKKVVMRATGVSRQGVDYWWSGRNEIKDNNIEKIIDAIPSLNKEWVWTGKGKPELSEYKSIEGEEVNVVSDNVLTSDRYTKTIDALMKALQIIENKNNDLEEQVRILLEEKNKKNS